MREDRQCSEKGRGEGEGVRGEEEEERNLLRSTPGPYFFTKGAGPQTIDEDRGSIALWSSGFPKNWTSHESIEPKWVPPLSSDASGMETPVF